MSSDAVACLCVYDTQGAVECGIAGGRDVFWGNGKKAAGEKSDPEKGEGSDQGRGGGSATYANAAAYGLDDAIKTSPPPSDIPYGM